MKNRTKLLIFVDLRPKKRPKIVTLATTASQRAIPRPHSVTPKLSFTASAAGCVGFKNSRSRELKKRQF
jgi:hypothetical protein